MNVCSVAPTTPRTSHSHQSNYWFSDWIWNQRGLNSIGFSSNFIIFIVFFHSDHPFSPKTQMGSSCSRLGSRSSRSRDCRTNRSKFCSLFSGASSSRAIHQVNSSLSLSNLLFSLVYPFFPFLVLLRQFKSKSSLKSCLDNLGLTISCQRLTLDSIF